MHIHVVQRQSQHSLVLVRDLNNNNNNNNNNILYVKWGSLVTMTWVPTGFLPGARPFAGNEFPKGKHPDNLSTDLRSVHLRLFLLIVPMNAYSRLKNNYF
jgi:hypothetical protein